MTEQSKKKCDYWKHHGANIDGDLQGCTLEESPEMMVQCCGNEARCRNLPFLREMIAADFGIKLHEELLRGKERDSFMIEKKDERN